MISVKNAAQIDKMRAAGRLLHEVLAALRPMVKPGATTLDIDRKARRMIADAGAIPSFLGYRGFPAALCASVNAAVVHGIPNANPLAEGDILGVDCGVILDGWQSDSAFTVGVGRISEEARKLIAVTEECFWCAFAKARKGARVGDISWAIQRHAESFGYQPIRQMCGHGIGRKMHEEPEVPNFGEPGRGPRLLVGMTLAIEPMIAAGGWEIDINGWDVVTHDRSLCAHYEHTVLITDGEPEILSIPRSVARAATL